MAEYSSIPVNYGSEWYIPVKISYYPGEDNAVMMSWDNRWKATSSFDVFWRFSLINGKFIDETSTVSIIPDNMSYQAKTTYDPDITKAVTGWVRPREAEDGEKWGYLCPWSPNQAGASLYPLEWKSPSDLKSINFSIDNYTLELIADIGKDVNGEFDHRTTHVEFQISVDTRDPNISGVVQSGRVQDTRLKRVPVDRATGLAKIRITANAGWVMRARARGLNGNAGYLQGDWTDYSGYVYAPPVSPVARDAKALSPTSVRVSLAKAVYGDKHEIAYTSNLEEFKIESGGSTAGPFDGNAYTIEGLETGKTWYFRIRAVNSTGSSAWSNVVSATLGIRPTPPTTWSNVVTAKIGEDLVLNWTHNSRDGSDMKEAQIEIDNSSSGMQLITVEGKKDSDTQEWMNTLNYVLKTDSYSDGTVIRWRVRTKGVLEEYSDWSITREIKVYSPPSVFVVPYKTQIPTENPLENLDSFPFYIIATANPSSQRSIAFHISIVANSAYQKIAPNGENIWVSENEEVYSRYFDYDGSLDLVEFGDYAVVSNNVLTLKLMPSDVDFETGISYTIKATVAMDNGLSADGYNVLTISWQDQTLYPNADTYVDEEDYTVTIVPYCTVETSPEQMEEFYEEEKTDRDLPLVENVLLSVYRIEYDGNMVLIMDEIANDRSTAVIDPHPPLNYARYRIVATDQETGSVGFVDTTPVFLKGTGIVIQWEETWNPVYTNPNSGRFESAASWTGSRLILPANVDTTEGNKIDKTLVEYIGGKHPVSYYGTQMGTTATWNAVFPKADVETLELLRRLSSYIGDVYVREPKGVGYWASIDVSYNIQHLNLIIPVTLNVTRVEGGI